MTLQSEPVEISKCPVCGSTEIRSSDGFIVCTKCGSCQNREIVQGSYTSQEGQFARTQFVDLGNKIHVANAQGSEIGYKTERQSIFKVGKVMRLKRTQHQTTMQIEERLMRGLMMINKVTANLQLPTQTRDRAAYLLRKILPHFNLHRNQKHLVICVIVLAIREHQLPIKEKEVIEIIPLRSKTRRQLNQTKFFIMEHMGISWRPAQAEHFIPKILSNLQKIPQVLEKLEKQKGALDYFNRLERLATKLILSMTFFDYGGRFPNILAASAIYAIDFLLLKIMTQKNIGEASGVVEFAIRTHYKDVWKPRMKKIQELLEVTGK